MTAWSHVPFDQLRYQGQRGIDGRGACEGWAREAIRRLDRAHAASSTSLLTVAHAMSRDASRRRIGIAGDLFSRVGRFQLNASSLGLRRLRLRLTVRSSPDAPRDDKIRSTVRSVGNELRESEVALVRVGLNSTRPAGQQYGHALLIQRLPHDEYTIFDPNNGAFLYRSQQDMQLALRAYMTGAFTEPELELEAAPESVEYFAPAVAPIDEVRLPQSSPLQSPPLLAVPHAGSSTRTYYEANADESNELSDVALSAAAGGARRLRDVSGGLARYALREVARGHASNLTDATENMRDRLADYRRRSESIDDIRGLNEQDLFGPAVELPNWTRRPGGFRMTTPEQLTDDLRQHFSASRDTENTLVPYRNGFAEIRMSFRRPPNDTGHCTSCSSSHAASRYSVTVQRRRLSDDFAQDGYELHDPESGVFRYANFREMSDALGTVMARGYPEHGGIDHVDTVYFGHHDDGPVVHTGEGPRIVQVHESRAPNTTLGGIEPLLGIAVNPLQVTPTVPTFDEPDLGCDISHLDLKRSTEVADDRQPYVLYRPSTLAPNVVAAHGGFECEDTALRNVNLDLHDFDLASQAEMVDSAGYLATFRSPRAALSRLPDDAANGFMYFVAPTPNMVDVTRSLGWSARQPERPEVAAMGRIDYAQIRGWCTVTNGVASQFVRNPAYRWDIYNQTRTAGEQTQLSRLPLASDAWTNPRSRAWVAWDRKGKATRFNESPDLSVAHFYDNAADKVRRLNERQAAGLDYRGPLTLEAYGGNSIDTHLFIAGNGATYVASRYKQAALDSASRHRFSIGEDGRFHLADDYAKVLRVGSDGYVYLGVIPSNPNSTNGVFDYIDSQLIHREDGKFLTTGKSVWTPYVTSKSEGSRSLWELRKPDEKPANPPAINTHTYSGKTIDARALYLFENDPDAALPEGTTHFVTSVPGNSFSGDFAVFHTLISPAEIGNISGWLSAHNAAWLFKDGYSLFSPSPGYLEARTPDGAAHWGAHVDTRTGTAKFSAPPAASNYRIEDEVWQRIRHREVNRELLTSQLAS
ncbi:enterotoxin A family protein [Paraburkholderia rhizosphaerae]|nr:enterotoxin A family protein [Paraburkholderia rhizosphaerae]